jgi:hypothetical protein
VKKRLSLTYDGQKVHITGLGNYGLQLDRDARLLSQIASALESMPRDLTVQRTVVSILMCGNPRQVRRLTTLLKQASKSIKEHKSSWTHDGYFRGL